MKYRVRFQTPLYVTVEIEAEDEDNAADAAWPAAQAHVQTYTFTHSTHDDARVNAEADFDGIGAEAVEPTDTEETAP